MLEEPCLGLLSSWPLWPPLPAPRPAQTLLLVVVKGPGLINLNNVWGDYSPGLPEIEGFPRRGTLNAKTRPVLGTQDGWSP